MIHERPSVHVPKPAWSPRRVQQTTTKFRVYSGNGGVFMKEFESMLFRLVSALVFAGERNDV